MKELYIRKGNSLDTQNIIIIGEEQFLGDRDLSGYKPNKGAIFNPVKKTDPFSKNENLTYIHCTPNIKLDTEYYSRDYDVHIFVKNECKDLVKWDGETNEGLVHSREAFICKSKDVQKVANELYKRIEWEIHKRKRVPLFYKKLFKFIFLLPFKIIKIALKVVLFILIGIFVGKKSKRTKYFRKIKRF